MVCACSPVIMLQKSKQTRASNFLHSIKDHKKVAKQGRICLPQFIACTNTGSVGNASPPENKILTRENS